MPSNSGYFPVNKGFRDNVNPSEAHAESIELNNGHFTNYTAETPALPPKLQLFNSSQQTRKLFFSQILRWLGTVIFIAFVLATLKIYENKDNFPHYQKYAFNTIITGLSLGLGLNFFEAFKDIAKVLRWRILANRRHSVREVDLILSIDSLSSVMELAWEGRKSILIVLGCSIWLFLNLAAQAAVAVIGLSYSVNSGTDYKGTYTQTGPVNASDLSCYYDNGSCPKAPEVDQFVAHSYGEIAQGSNCCPYKELSEVLGSDANCAYYCNRTPGQQEYAYRYRELNPSDHSRIYPLFTNRVLTASSGQCYQYNVDQNSGVKVNDLNGDLAAFNWSYSNGTVNGNITIPTEYSALDSTTYIYLGTQSPENETEYACGPRCMWVWAWRAKSTLSSDPNQPQTVFQCPITVSSVSNTTLDSQTITDAMAKLAAASIALQGRYVNTDEGRIWTQYQLYPYGSRWEVHNHPIDVVGSNMAEFALGSLASMATRNPTVQNRGTVPILGFSLTVEWKFTLALCVSIVAVHFILFAAAVYTSRLVIIKDDSNLSTARLLRPLVSRLGGKGTLLEGKEISKLLEKDGVGGLVYGPRDDGMDGERVLDISESVTTRRELENRRHPDGKYL